MSTINKQYFLDLMAARKLSVRGLAAKMGMVHSQLSLTLNDKRKMQLDEAVRLSQILGAPLYDIVVASGIEYRPMSGRRVTVVGFVGPTGAVQIHEPETIERTESPFALPDSAVAIQFRTAESPLSWMDAWIAFFVPRDTVSPECVGRFSICSIKNGPVVVATIKRGYRDGAFNLSGPVQHENAQLEWASPLIGCKF